MKAGFFGISGSVLLITNYMDKLFERHDIYLSEVPMDYIRDFMHRIQ